MENGMPSYLGGRTGQDVRGSYSLGPSDRNMTAVLPTTVTRVRVEDATRPRPGSNGNAEAPGVIVDTELCHPDCTEASASDGQDIEVFVIIVGYRNADDIVSCLTALRRVLPYPKFEVLIAENGGLEGFESLVSALTKSNSPCRRSDANVRMNLLERETHHVTFELCGNDQRSAVYIQVYQMPNNLGYAGAINALVRPLNCCFGWNALWILNPDTEPTSSALFELTSQACSSAKGMIGSRIVSASSNDEPEVYGLKWNKLSARTTLVTTLNPSQPRLLGFPGYTLDAVSGASIYITRTLLRRIGLMDERYFLYFEDLEWGYRAKALGELDFSYNSIVLHKGGTTIGSARNRAARSKLSVYLEFRNKILFVKHHHRRWLAWTVAMQSVHLAAFLVAGSFSNLRSAICGLAAGLGDKSGRPDWILATHPRR